MAVADRDGPRHVVVLGLMGSGKSSVGAALAARLGRPLRDNDVALRQALGASAAEHAATHGLDSLHRAEVEVLLAALADPEPAVVTAAASVADRPELATWLADHDVVWLDVDPLELAARIPQGADHRPLQVEALTQLRAQRQRRAPAFRAVADLVVTPRGEDPDELAARIERRLAGPGGTSD